MRWRCRRVAAGTLEALARVAAIAAIRTFLTYFLDHDLERAARANWPGRNATGRSQSRMRPSNPDRGAVSRTSG